MCAVISGDSVISVTGTGSGALPYTVSANICNGLSAITSAARNVLGTDKVVVVTEAGACRTVTVPEVCGVPAGGALNQTLMKASGTDCDLEWKTPPYARVTRSTAVAMTEGLEYTPDFDAAPTDPYGMWDSAGDPASLVIPWDGWWTFGGQVIVGTEPGADGYVTVRIGTSDGVTTTWSMLPSVTLSTTVDTYATSGTTGVYLSAGDTIFFGIKWTSTTVPTTATVEATGVAMWATWHSP